MVRTLAPRQPRPGTRPTTHHANTIRKAALNRLKAACRRTQILHDVQIIRPVAWHPRHTRAAWPACAPSYCPCPRFRPGSWKPAPPAACCCCCCLASASWMTCCACWGVRLDSWPGSPMNGCCCCGGMPPGKPPGAAPAPGTGAAAGAAGLGAAAAGACWSGGQAIRPIGAYSSCYCHPDDPCNAGDCMACWPAFLEWGSPGV